nr:MAG TPA: hypothetical protein [Caudoviricetes sp.]
MFCVVVITTFPPIKDIFDFRYWQNLAISI